MSAWGSHAEIIHSSSRSRRKLRMEAGPSPFVFPAQEADVMVVGFDCVKMLLYIEAERVVGVVL